MSNPYHVLARFRVYCRNKACGHVLHEAGYVIRPQMNYHGSRQSFFGREVHVYCCSICGRETHFRRSLFHDEWVRLR